MNVKDLRFKLGGVEIHPHYSELKRKFGKENQQEFFRESIEGSLTLIGADYLLVKNASIEDILYLQIEQKDKGQLSTQYQVIFEGYFSKTDCEIDSDNRTCKVKISPRDEYTDIMKGIENKYDLIKLAPALSQIGVSKRPIVQVYIAGASTISNYLAGTNYETEVFNVVTDNKELTDKNFFAFFAAYNEIEVKAVPYQFFNGKYYGTNGTYTKLDGNFSIKWTLSEGLNIGFLHLENKEGTMLYRSDKINWSDKSYYYIDVSEITFTRIVNDPTLPQKFGGNTVLLQKLFQRMLLNLPELDGKPTGKLSSEDVYPTNSNYMYAAPLKGNYFYTSTKVQNEPTEYGVNDEGKYFTDNFVPAVAGAGKLYPVCRSRWGNMSIWFEFDLSYAPLEERARKEYVLRDSFAIQDAIRALIKQIDPTLTHEATEEYSKFLYAGNNPISGAPFKVFITQKSNILKGEYDRPAKKAETTLSDIMKMLRDTMKLYWFIDGDKFRIEHISYFMNGGSYTGSGTVGIDLTKLRYAKSGQLMTWKTNTVKYDKTDLPSRFEFSWMDDTTNTFAGFPIDVKSNYVQEGKKEEVRVSNFSSDVDYMLLSPGDFSQDGFALLGATQIGGKWKLPFVTFNLVDKNNKKYTVNPQNGYMSFLHLVKYYMHDMPASEIEQGGDQTIRVRGIKRSMTQDLSFTYDTTPNPVQLITTDVGNGKPITMTEDLTTRQITVSLSYTPL
nr:MAG: hypothetical protein [Bacteriophage sp.]